MSEPDARFKKAAQSLETKSLTEETMSIVTKDVQLTNATQINHYDRDVNTGKSNSQLSQKYRIQS